MRNRRLTAYIIYGKGDVLYTYEFKYAYLFVWWKATPAVEQRVV